MALAMGKDGPEATVSIMLALSDFTAENGATRVVPGSHQWDDYGRQPAQAEIVQAVMPAGSALMYTGRTIHGAGANRTTQGWRFGIHLSFVLGQLTPEEAHPFTVPWAIAQKYSSRVQHMLGYRSHRTFDKGWPVVWLADYRELRDSLSPPPEPGYVSAGERLLPQIDAAGAAG
jgi:ectoine hydroxylase-related dioxygenase (phytanoyl-CoA dioxygenase family)